MCDICEKEYDEDEEEAIEGESILWGGATLALSQHVCKMYFCKMYCI
jgi:hypothetical protein